MTPFLSEGVFMKSSLLLGALLLAGCAQGPANKVMEVNSQLAHCVGVAPMKCMQVREQDDAPWQLFYQKIDGFEFEPGYRYRLEVAVRQVDNPPADGSSLHYQLVRVIDKQPVR
ncbi:hypothetical protein WL1483_2743 [Aeromonas schubertii]|uniref:DUF4377 domain-containing protein n=2 Tax=Aeromonas schubertii TaxID=652 RepID=A0A0S2SKL4_9GAMM|nr:hypothetical protein WL1483_2743 [Aeromonas schubertii]